MNGAATMRGKPGARRLDLDVVRGFAILLAMGWHLNGPPTGIVPLEWILAPGRKFGWAGVDLFFVLSGFLMGQIILTERTRTGAFDSKRFMIRRAFKLWPVLYLFLVAEVFLGDDPWNTFVPQVFFHVQNYFVIGHGHLWSLAVEEHFYLGIALLFPLFVRRGGSTRHLVGVLAFLVAAPLPLRVLGWVAGADYEVLHQQTQFRVDGLAAGMLLAVIALHRPAVFAGLLRWRLLWLAVCAAAVTFLSLVPNYSAFMGTVGFTITWIGAAACLLLVYDNSLVERFRPVSRPIALAGFYSYSIYIWHNAVAGAVAVVVDRLWPSVPAPVMVFAKYSVSIFVAIVIAKLVERPMLRLRDRLFPARGRVSRPGDTVPEVRAEPDSPAGAPAGTDRERPTPSYENGAAVQAG